MLSYHLPGSHDPAEINSRVRFSNLGTGVGKDSQHEEINSPNCKKLKDNNGTYLN